MKTMTLKANEYQVATMKDLAEELKAIYGWSGYSVCMDGIEFEADGKRGYVGLDGVAVSADGVPWPDYDVDWAGDFDDWSNHVWLEDENGRTVMVHD